MSGADGSVVIFDRKSWIAAAESRGNPWVS